MLYKVTFKQLLKFTNIKKKDSIVLLLNYGNFIIQQSIKLQNLPIAYINLFQYFTWKTHLVKLCFHLY